MSADDSSSPMTASIQRCRVPVYSSSEVRIFSDYVANNQFFAEKINETEQRMQLSDLNSVAHYGPMRFNISSNMDILLGLSLSTHYKAAN